MNANDGGPRTTLSQLKADSTASMQELQSFLTEFKGKDPREVMGVIANSGLARSIFVALIGCVLILAAGTVGPFMIWGGKVDEAAASKDSKKKAIDSAIDDGEDEQTKKRKKKKAKQSLASQAKDNKQEAAKKMGISETKKGDAGKLLDKLDKVFENEQKKK